VIDAAAQRFGLPNCLRIPIAAASLEAIARYVGAVRATVPWKGQAGAVLVEPHPRSAGPTPGVALWTGPDAKSNDARLHPDRQVWVHVDYDGYRDAYQRLGLPIPPGCVLDHVQNREAVRLGGYAHPYLRLCPVRGQVNTSAGHRAGGEGMEKGFLRDLPGLSAATRAAAGRALRAEMVYADPMDLTKMLDIAPGTRNLAGVAATQKRFYPG
jgi:hypothetical protein